jgi:uncharacterized protein YbjT (DUF2867 family)
MILVAGGTGRVGRWIVEGLRARGAPTRVMTRRLGRGAGIDGVDGVEYVPGDLLDGGSVTAALDGVDRVVCTAHGGGGAGSGGPRGVEGRGLPELIRQSARAGVRQFVYLSSASAHPGSPADLFRGKAAVEAALRASGVPHSVVRGTHLLDTWVPMLGEPLVKKAQAMIIGNGHNPVSWVAGSDLAAAAVALAVEDGAVEDGANEHVVLGGQESLTLRELNARVEDALGVTARKTTVMAPGVLRFAGRVVRPFNEVLSRQMRLGALLDTLPQTVDSTGAWERLGIEPVTVDEWLDGNLPALARGWRPDAAAMGR